MKLGVVEVIGWTLGLWLGLLFALSTAAALLPGLTTDYVMQAAVLALTYFAACALFAARRYAEATDALQRIAAGTDHLHHAFLAACFAQAGDAARAGAQAQEALKRKPDFSVRKDCLPTLHYQRESDLAHHRDALLKAGLPA